MSRKITTPCKVPVCDRRGNENGYCHAHNEWKRRHGVEPTHAIVHLSLEERFWSKVNKSAGCWLWEGATDGGHRYGAFWNPASRKVERAHRFSYQLTVGLIPAGRVLDHRCRVTLCVNPAHLEVVTQADNIRRGDAPPAVNARKTHCKWGHELPPFTPGGKRLCAECESIWNALCRQTGRGRAHGLKRAEALAAHFAERAVAA